MEFVGKEYGPGIGRPPQDGLIVAVPGKDAVPVGFEQSFGSQVATDGEQAIGRGLLNGWKAQIRSGLRSSRTWPSKVREAEQKRYGSVLTGMARRPA